MGDRDIPITRSEKTDQQLIEEALSPYLNQYCHACGRKVVLMKKWVYDYDPDTGKKRFMYRIGCPKYAWWKIPLRSNWLHKVDNHLVCTPKTFTYSDEKYVVVLTEGV